MSDWAMFAGRGSLPKYVIAEIPDIKVICFEGENNPDLKPDLTTRFGQVGFILNYLQENQIKKIIFAGAMNRPDIKKLSPDAEGAKLLAKIIASSFFNKNAGDDKLLTVLTKYLEDRGFEVVGVHEVLKNIQAPKGILGKVTPTEQQVRDIETGITALKTLGSLDIGQAIVIEEGVILAVEAVEGTEKMIERAGIYKKSYGGVLLKFKKPEQNEKVDLPVIGVDTIGQIKAAGICGIALEAGSALIIGCEQVITQADEAGVFVIGI